jgi:hypothetical protein
MGDQLTAEYYGTMQQNISTGFSSKAFRLGKIMLRDRNFFEK